jgi:hypothetical protein
VHGRLSEGRLSVGFLPVANHTLKLQTTSSDRRQDEECAPKLPQWISSDVDLICS